ncbi:MAG TPA: NVEALA domain-containing protein [Sphingobacterium sp.]|nr:NVEALA domain-containing protein [Sphingobacterium sp.]
MIDTVGGMASARRLNNVIKKELVKALFKSNKMKKKILGSIVAVAIAAVAAVNVNFNNEAGNGIVALSVTNVEALAQNENTEGAESIIVTDMGSTTQCVNGNLYSVNSFAVTCLGKGRLPCQSGTFQNITYVGICQYT